VDLGVGEAADKRAWEREEALMCGTDRKRGAQLEGRQGRLARVPAQKLNFGYLNSNLLNT
jgi:hypothetical protein